MQKLYENIVSINFDLPLKLGPQLDFAPKVGLVEGMGPG
jgi:hypothetical protein